MRNTSKNSTEAYSKNKTKIMRSREKIYLLLFEYYNEHKEGLDSSEISLMTGLSSGSVTGRLNELRHKEKLIRVEKVENGRNVYVPRYLDEFPDQRNITTEEDNKNLRKANRILADEIESQAKEILHLQNICTANGIAV